jgi:peptidoglycan/LPS O-acetylase OafA/YrhL
VPSLDDAFADRLNGLTTLRMSLACLVLRSHADVLGRRLHDPLKVRSLTTFAIVVPLAVLSWHFVERPMMRLKNWHRTGGTQPGVTGRRWSFPRFRRVDP